MLLYKDRVNVALPSHQNCLLYGQAQRKKEIDS